MCVHLRAPVFKVKREREGESSRRSRGPTKERYDRPTSLGPGEEPSENKQTASRSRSLCVHGILIIPWARSSPPQRVSTLYLIACIFFFVPLTSGSPTERWDHTLHARDIDYRGWNRARVWFPFEPRHVEANEANYAQLETSNSILNSTVARNQPRSREKICAKNRQFHSNRTLSRLIFFPSLWFFANYFALSFQWRHVTPRESDEYSILLHRARGRKESREMHESAFSHRYSRARFAPGLSARGIESQAG